MRAMLLAGCVAACGGDPEPYLLEGSPDATRAIAFDNSRTPVAIGGESAFGLAYLQKRDSDRWIRAEGLPGFDASARLLGGDALPLYALSQTTLYRLADPASFRWDATTIPAGVTEDTTFGVDEAGTVYAVELLPDGAGAVFAWTPGEPRWREVAGTRPLGVDAARFVVEPSGRVTWVVPSVGVVRAEGGTQATIVDCTATIGCADAISSLGYDTSGTLTFLVCPFDGMRAAYRLTGDDLQTIAIPATHDACLGLDTIADGTSLLASLAVATPDDGGLHLLGRGETSWERIAGSSPAFTYVLRDVDTVFAVGDGQAERGIYQIDL